MRTEGAIFFRNSEGSHFFVNRGCQRSQSRAGFQANPEDACRFRRRKESISAELNFSSQSAQGMLDLLDRRFGLLANEFQRHMQRLWFQPARIRSESVYTLHETGDACADGVVNVESNEEAHKQLLASSSWLLA